MTRLEQFVAALSDDELRRFSVWFGEMRWQRWDRRLENDVSAGRLDRLIADAKAEIAAGKTRSL